MTHPILPQPAPSGANTFGELMKRLDYHLAQLDEAIAVALAPLPGPPPIWNVE